MPKISLTSFVEQQIEIFKFPDNQQSKLNISQRFRKELVKMGEWAKGEKRTIGRAHHTFFEETVLYRAYETIEPYLLKKGGLDKDLIEQERQRILANKEAREAEIDRLAKMSPEEQERHFNQEETNIPLSSFTPSKQEQIELMITAIFQKFYEPINIDQWRNDEYIRYLYQTPDYNQTDIAYITAMERLNNPLKSYTQKK